ncbi:MAG TPA: polysaccharide deacetylase family protein [Burkholderiales bacterium]|nr:polysaccharide deacetylase family protein [Burkholderiales bacterium]
MIFTGDLGYSVRRGIAALADAYPSVSWLVAEQQTRRSLRQRLSHEIRQLKRNGWRWIPHRVADVGRAVRERARGVPAASANAPGGEYEWAAITARPAISHFTTANLHEEGSLRRVREFAPDLGISLAAPILRPELFEIPSAGTINLHKGRLPAYRGMPPAFWEMFHGEQEVGCTVHRVTAGLDAGPILVEDAIRREPFSTVRGLQLKLDELGVRLMVEAVGELATGTAHWKDQAPGGRTFTKPTLRDRAVVRSRERAPEARHPAREIAKELAFWNYVSLVRPLPRRMLALSGRQRIVALLYHRVNDSMRDSLTVGIEQFDRQMAWIRRNYPVASIEDVVRDRAPTSASRPVIVVTFDDGYRDNYENAVPILLRHRIPAAFFVSTGMIGTERGFEHDRKVGPIPTMTWDQLREMQRLGFVIGSHAATHIDCGSADIELVRRELAESRGRLVEELGARDLIFAYPFGGPHNITPPALNVVKELGFIGCLSAYGGVNRPKVSPFNVLRVGISHRFTMLAFRSRLEGFA